MACAYARVYVRVRVCVCAYVYVYMCIHLHGGTPARETLCEPEISRELRRVTPPREVVVESEVCGRRELMVWVTDEPGDRRHRRKREGQREDQAKDQVGEGHKPLDDGEIARAAISTSRFATSRFSISTCRLGLVLSAAVASVGGRAGPY